jgi:hypothetical protein
MVGLTNEYRDCSPFSHLIEDYNNWNMTPLEISKLPNIFQLVESLKLYEHDLMRSTNGWSGFTIGDYRPICDMSYHLLNSDRIYINNEDDDKFIVNRLNSKRYAFKPNLREHRFLFRGQNKAYDRILSSFSRGDLDDHLISNLKCGDFISLLRSHPLFMMFERGIHLEPERKPFFFEMNYYGLAQHYGFNTGLVDFTSDIAVAAFFACTKYKGNDTYEPIVDTKQYPYGVIYAHGIIPTGSFVGFGFRSIGLQVYPRTGAQKGFFYEEGGTRVPLEQMVSQHYFRHDATCSRKVFQLMEEGKRLFPEDDVQPYAQMILNSNEVTGYSFADNLYTNQDDCGTNLKRLERKGITVNWGKQWMFTPEMLHSYYQNIKNGLWEKFCNKIAFADENEQQLKDSLLKIPQSPHYRQFFEEKELERLQYVALTDRSRAERNRTNNHGNGHI